MARPRGPNYQKNIERMRRAVEKSGATALAKTAEVERRLEREPEVVERQSTLAHGFLKALARLEIAQKFKEAVEPKKYALKDNRVLSLLGDGVLYRPPWRIADSDLRQISYTSSLIGAIHQVCADDVELHSQPDPQQGFRVTTLDPEQKTKKGQEDRIRELEMRIQRMGTREAAGPGRVNLGDALEMATRDVLTIDRISVLKTLSKKGDVVDATYLDPATIYPVDPVRGYKGDTSIGHVQAVDYEVVETYPKGRIIRRFRTAVSDMRYRDDGLSPLENCIYEIMTGLYALRSNMDRFNGRTPPEMLFTSKNKIDTEVEALIETLWETNFGGDRNIYGRIPIIHGVDGFEVHNLNFNSDMLYNSLMQWVYSSVLARHAMDEAEVGLRYQQTARLSEPSTDGRASRSRARRHGSIMRFHQGWINDTFDLELQEPTPLRVIFTGVTEEDEDKKLDREAKAQANFKTLDEQRADRDLPPIGEVLQSYFPDDEDAQKAAARLGGMIMNQHFAQPYGQMVGGGAGPNQTSEPSFDGGFGNQDGDAEQLRFEDLFGNDGDDQED